MANTTATSNLQFIRFLDNFFVEYVRKNRLSPYSGEGMDNPIHIQMGRQPTIRFPLLTRLTGTGVSGASTLRGNGEQALNYSWDVNPTYYRHSVEFTKEDLEQPNFDMLAAARPLLLDWAMAKTRDDEIQALAAVYNGTTYANLDDATEANKDAWLVANADRQIFGASAGSGTDHSADLAQIDSTNDTFTAARVSDLRRLAEDADPHIRPIRTDDGSEVFVAFAGSIAFRDLKSNLQTILSNADVRGMKMTRNGNTLANDGDLLWDGVIIRKVPEITSLLAGTGKSLAGVGASSINVDPVFLCGAQALLWGLGQKPQIRTDMDYDYQFQPGVAIELKHDIQKAFFNSIQHGVVTGYFSGAA